MWTVNSGYFFCKLKYEDQVECDAHVIFVCDLCALFMSRDNPS